ncbi:MAG: thiamine-phosphate kinase, partial [Candidatus Eisenbacteria bacterium]
MSKAPTLLQLGEFGAIDLLRQVLAGSNASGRHDLLELQDDAALFSIEPGRQVVATCDVQVSGRHFLPAALSAQELGARALTVNLSDLAAVGARPERVLISLGLPGSFLVRDLRDLYRGIIEAMAPHEMAVIGGNFTGMSEGCEWFIDMTVLGSVPAGGALSRGGAHAGDVIAVTGSPGSSAAGLALVEHVLAPVCGAEPSTHVSLGSARMSIRELADSRAWARELLDAYLRPRARVEAGRILRGRASALIDISDGWRSDLGHLCRASRVRAVLDRPFPISRALLEAASHLQIPIEEWLYGPSDDYELMMTVPPHAWDEVRSRLAEGGLRVHPIGTMHAGEAGIEATDDFGRDLPS